MSIREDAVEGELVNLLSCLKFSDEEKSELDRELRYAEILLQYSEQKPPEDRRFLFSLQSIKRQKCNLSDQ